MIKISLYIGCSLRHGCTFTNRVACLPRPSCAAAGCMASHGAAKPVPVTTSGHAANGGSPPRGNAVTAAGVRPAQVAVSPGSRAQHQRASRSPHGAMANTPGPVAAGEAPGASVRMVVCLSRRRPAQWPADVTSMLRAHGEAPHAATWLVHPTVPSGVCRLWGALRHPRGYPRPYRCRMKHVLLPCVPRRRWAASADLCARNCARSVLRGGHGLPTHVGVLAACLAALCLVAPVLPLRVLSHAVCGHFAGTVSFVTDIDQLRHRIGLPPSHSWTDALGTTPDPATDSADRTTQRPLLGAGQGHVKAQQKGAATRVGKRVGKGTGSRPAGSKTKAKPLRAGTTGSGGGGGRTGLVEGRGGGVGAAAGAVALGAAAATLTRTTTSTTATTATTAPPGGATTQACGSDASSANAAVSPRRARGCGAAATCATRPALVIVDVATTGLRSAAHAVQLCSQRPPKPAPRPASEPLSASSGSNDGSGSHPAPAPVQLQLPQACAVAVAWAESLRDVGSALEAGFGHASVGVGVQRLRSVVERSVIRLRRRSGSVVSAGTASVASPGAAPAVSDVVGRADLGVAVVLVAPTPGDAGATPEATLVSILAQV